MDRSLAMKKRFEQIKKFVDLSMQWNGKVCIYGAGRIGTGWAYDLVHTFAGMNVDSYVDSYRFGGEAHGIAINGIEYIKENAKDLLCFVAMAGENAKEVYIKLQELSVAEIIVINGEWNIDDVAQYVCEYCTQEVIEKYHKLTDDKQYLVRYFKEHMGYEFDIDNPRTFNEKLQWLKVNERNPILTILADKYRVRDYMREHFGEEYLIPLLFDTDDYRQITKENIPDEHCIIKSNCGCHDFHIIRDRNLVNIEELQNQYKRLMEANFYYVNREWHYKDIKPRIIIEKLLETKEGKIPNDYKLTFFNGELQFIYCTIDREGADYRKIYSPNWEPMRFSMAAPMEICDKYPEIAPPKSLDEMIRIGKEMASKLRYVRMDYYDVDGKLYFGEVTLCHGAGCNKFYPPEYDYLLGEKFCLN